MAAPSRLDANPFSRVAYSYVPVNGLEAQHVLAQPIGDTLFFAGQATGFGHIGTVHGAILSGQRSAKEILNSPTLEKFLQSRYNQP